MLLCFSLSAISFQPSAFPPAALETPAPTAAVSAVFAGGVSLAAGLLQLLQNLAVGEISAPQCGQDDLSCNGASASCFFATVAPQLRQNRAVTETSAPHCGQEAVSAFFTTSTLARCSSLALAMISWASAPQLPQNLVPSVNGVPQVQVAIGFSTSPADQGVAASKASRQVISFWRSSMERSSS